MSVGLMRVKMKVTKTNEGVEFAQLAALVAQAVDDAGEEVLDVLHKVTGIQYQTLKELAMMGHPYAAADPHPPQNPGLINKQSGEFTESFSRTPAHLIGDRIITDIFSDSDKAEMLLNGTPRMIERPYMDIVEARYQRVIVQKIVAKLQKFMKVRVR